MCPRKRHWEFRLEEPKQKCGVKEIPTVPRSEVRCYEEDVSFKKLVLTDSFSEVEFRVSLACDFEPVRTCT
jgi:hypothetical protein